MGGWWVDEGWMDGRVESGLLFSPCQSPHHSKRTFLKDKKTSWHI